MQVVLDLEYDTEKVVDLRGNKLTLYCYDDGYINAYYSIDNYIFTVTADNLSEEEIIKILDMILEEMLDMH
jgi:DNA-binding ferritin-like protein (Dps family)